MKWLRDKISHWFGWETYEEALERIHAEIERDHPRPTPEDVKLRNEMAAIAREVIRRRLDHDGEYKRGIEGMQ